MTDKEKLLLLDLILQDIRGNWGFDLESRIAVAFELAEELKLEQFIESINEFEERNGDDGRFFRTTYSNGGYIGMKNIHGLPYKITGRSEEFKRQAEVLTYPELIFEDLEG